jgi:predicted DCC family thiol-disulfide oxidoreductase YuxK
VAAVNVATRFDAFESVRFWSVSDQARTSSFIFDGDCGFCTASAHWLQQKFRRGECVTAGQLLSDQVLQSLGLIRTDVEQAAWWVDASGNLARGHRAIGKALQASGGSRRVVGWLALTPPTSWLAGAVYGVVVRWRYRLPGASPACRIDRDVTRDTQ